MSAAPVAGAGPVVASAPSARGLAWPSARSWADIGVLLGLALLGVVGFEPSFGGASFLAAGLGGLLLGALTGIGASVARLSGLTTLLVAVVGYFLVGPAVAVPAHAILGFVPTLQGFANVAIGTVYGWADIVTLATPVGAPVYIAVVPYAASWLVALVSTTLATRWLARRERAPWRFAIALIGPVALYLGVILVGTDDAYQAGIRGVAFALVALVWLGWRRPIGGVAAGSTASLRRRKLAGTAILAAGATVVGVGTGVVLAPPDESRFVLREEVEPPFDPLDYPSPLAGFRHYTKQVTDELLFTAEGLEPGDRIRLATLDSFTGKLWNVTGPESSAGGSGSFELVGRTLPAPPLATTTRHDPVTITIEGYADVWVPGVGYAGDLELLGEAAARSDELRYNAATGSMVLTSGIAEGDRYRVEPVVQEPVSIEELSGTPVAQVELPPVDRVPDIVAAKAQELAGESADPAEQLDAMRLGLVRNGFLSHGRASDSVPSRAGHGADRIVELFERPQMIGDEEQYASAFALMARSLGYPARVVMGFAPEVGEGGGAVEVTGDDVTAWVEVAFDGVGWVPFEPTPDETDIPQDQEPRPQSEPQPQVRQPPRAESDEDELLSPVELDEGDEDDLDALFVLPAWVVGVGVSILVLALVVFGPALALGLVKARRLRRRRGAAAEHDRVAGAWEELADRYSELGFELPARSTRGLVAASLERQLAAVPGEAPPPRLRVLADATDEAVFSGRELSREEGDRVWGSALEAVDAAEAALPRSRRLLSRYRVRTARDLVARLSSSGRRGDR